MYYLASDSYKQRFSPFYLNQAVDVLGTSSDSPWNHHDKQDFYTSELIRNIHRDGAKQAVVQSIINCCDTLEIRICATGIEKAEEWMWLESAGIAYFQGPLFSGYSDDGLPFVSWPDPVEI